MAIKEFTNQQDFPAKVPEIWSFISVPQNLALITPPSVDFNIISGNEAKAYEGQIITFTVKPLLGIKLKWVTKISGYSEEDHSFVDEQLKGPYKFWQHKRFLTEIPGGTRMTDIVKYDVGYSFLGKIAERLFVEAKLQEIFDYRRKKLCEVFGEM